MWKIINTAVGISIMTLGMFWFAKIVLNKKNNENIFKIVLSILISTGIYTSIYLNFDGTLKTLMIFVVLTIFYNYIFKISLSKSIFTSVLYIIMLIIPDLLGVFIPIKILGISKEFYYDKLAGSIPINILVCILLVLITYIIRKPLQKAVAKIKDNTSNNSLIILSLLTMVCVLLLFYIVGANFRFNKEFISYLVTMFVIVLMLISLIVKTIQNNQLTAEYDELLKTMVTFEHEVENQRILRHEMKNEFRTIRAKISDEQSNKEIIEYIDEIVKDKYKINKEKYAKFGYLPPNGIKGLCYFKAQEAEDKGINVGISISKKIQNSTIYNLNVKEQRDLGRILGVILDNAIEASAESKDKQMGIEVYSNNDNEVKFIISNSFNNNINHSKIGLERFSTKGQNRGHGLLLVNQLVNKNKMFVVQGKVNNNIYVQNIEIKKL